MKNKEIWAENFKIVSKQHPLLIERPELQPGFKINYRGYALIIVGWKKESYKKPIRLKNSKGELLKCSVTALIREYEKGKIPVYDFS